MTKKADQIEFLLFTVKQTDDSICDVGIDFEHREYRIETTDLYGELLGPRSEGKLRRTNVKELTEALNALDFLSWPKNEKHTLPIHLENATIIYSIDGEQFFTTGNNKDDLSKLHKMIEQLLGTTFGSYAYY